VNYDLPENPEGYVHRIGRTARAGKHGKAVSFACERFVFGLEAIEAFIGFKIPVRPVTDELIADDASRGLRLGAPLRGGRDRETDRRDRGWDERRRPKALPAATPAAAIAEAPGPGPGRGSDLDARLEYYRRKYGENFKAKR
jgi:ATP-dependent RNA helicase RhlB